MLHARSKVLRHLWLQEDVLLGSPEEREIGDDGPLRIVMRTKQSLHRPKRAFAFAQRKARGGANEGVGIRAAEQALKARLLDGIEQVGGAVGGEHRLAMAGSGGRLLDRRGGFKLRLRGELIVAFVAKIGRRFEATGEPVEEARSRARIAEPVRTLARQFRLQFSPNDIGVLSLDLVDDPPRLARLGDEALVGLHQPQLSLAGGAFPDRLHCHQRYPSVRGRIPWAVSSS